MTKHEAIEIDRVVNGFLVRPASWYTRGQMGGVEDVYVFSDAFSLASWVAKYFGDETKNDS